jgi:hypothetical protein
VVRYQEQRICLYVYPHNLQHIYLFQHKTHNKMARVRRRSRLLSWYVTVPLSLAVVVACGVMWYDLDDDRKEDLMQWKFFPASKEEEDGVEFDDTEEEGISQLREKYAALPEFFDLNAEGHQKFSPNQFIHLHHMKTGGTSMDALLRCAMNRLKKDGHYDVSYFNIHECSEKYYESCLAGDERCLQRAHDASIMSYCAPLKDLPVFGWNNTHSPGVGSVTVLRHPVDRVWSMYRFQTKTCYQCRTLLDVYEKIDANTTQSFKSANCIRQLLNHETANLLSTAESAGNSDDQKAVEAIENLNFFTLVGLTEALPDTVDMAGRLFPWMADSVDWSETKCRLDHKNASPENNHCGPGGHSHMDLPDHPDEDTRRAIEAHNPLDMRLYEAAVRHFELQKRALGMD